MVEMTWNKVIQIKVGKNGQRIIGMSKYISLRQAIALFQGWL
jgi:hypothetical protein